MPELNRRPIFQAVRTLLKTHQPNWVTFTQPEVVFLDDAIDEALDTLVLDTPVSPSGIAKPGAFAFGAASKKALENVHPKLRLVIERSINYSPVDFRVNGERSLADQKKAVASGNSRTMKSKHLRQKDGTVWAVDCIALVNGKVSWDFPLYAAIACAVDKAATELGFADHIRWGCAWDRVLSDFGGDVKAYLAEAKAYAARHAGSDLIDGPHFEWVP
jgi:hypothetical protein